jgi:hypothetical protein
VKAKLIRANTRPELIVEGEFGSCRIRLVDLAATRVMLVTVEPTEGEVVVDELDPPTITGSLVVDVVAAYRKAILEARGEKVDP